MRGQLPLKKGPEGALDLVIYKVIGITLSSKVHFNQLAQFNCQHEEDANPVGDAGDKVDEAGVTQPLEKDCP